MRHIAQVVVLVIAMGLASRAEASRPPPAEILVPALMGLVAFPVSRAMDLIMLHDLLRGVPSHPRIRFGALCAGLAQLPLGFLTLGRSNAGPVWLASACLTFLLLGSVEAADAPAWQNYVLYGHR